jgi:PAS domain S-box-containing protein
MNSSSKHLKLEYLIYLVITAVFIAAAASWNSHLKKNDWNDIRRHALIIENDLWDLNSDGSRNYLELAARMNNYAQLTVYSSNNDIFTRVQGAELNPLDTLLSRLGLIPIMNMEADISHNGILIGRIEAIHRHDVVYAYIYLAVVMLLLMLSLRFFIRIVQAKKTLELRVQERTEELAEEKERLSVTLCSIGDGVISTDLEGKIVLVNAITEQLTGWSRQEAVGRPLPEVFNIINEQTGQPCDNPVDKVLATGRIVDLANHTVLIARDGSRYAIEDSGAPIFDQQGNIIGTVLVYRDVTEEKRTNAELAKIKKLESVGVLAGGIAHDFNNILTAILGNVELATMYTEPDSEAYPLLGESRKAAIRAKDLTQQLLTFARGGDPVKQTASIDGIITDSANFVLHGSSVACDYHIPEDLWQVAIDTGQISQVIQNIILNASQAMPEGGIIEVTCQNIENIDREHPALPQAKYIKIIIADSGPGIPAKIIDKIFDPYFSTKTKGSGLGLAICHSIINKHDGAITVQSAAKKGTRFTIYLPVSSSQPQADLRIKQDPVTPAKKTTVMLMDDDAMIRAISEKMLTRSGHKVILVKNGHEAIEQYNEDFKTSRTIDIIIMDLTIPGGMGGKDTVREILRINPEAKVIVASGYSNDPVMAHYQQYGFTASISKPFQFAVLNRLIEDSMMQ